MFSSQALKTAPIVWDGTVALEVSFLFSFLLWQKKQHKRYGSAATQKKNQHKRYGSAATPKKKQHKRYGSAATPKKNQHKRYGSAATPKKNQT